MDTAAFVSAFGAGLLLVYALGLRIPFLVIALAANLLLARLSKIHKFSRKTAATLVAAVALWALAMFAFAGCGQSSDSNSGSSASNSGGSQRVQLSAGRDITLSPAQNDEALNYFGYPYGEVDGSALDFYDPENFSCRISFTAE